jgi:RNA polymerase sigma-70 factor (subfamily 1)
MEKGGKQAVTGSLNHRTVRLITLAQGGDRAALEELCRTYSERVRRIVRLRMGRQLRSKLESMDVVQDAMICALRGLGTFTYTDEGDFTRWLSRITENRLRDHRDRFTAAKRDARREIPLDNSSGDSRPSDAQPVEPLYTVTPSMEIDKKEQLDRLERAMETLKPEYKEVVLLTKIEGLSHQQAADKLGKSPDAVRMLLCRAMAALSETYEREK